MSGRARSPGQPREILDPHPSPAPPAAPARIGALAKIPALGWDEDRPAPVALVSGPEELLAERAVGHRGYARRPSTRSLEVSDLDATSAALGDLTTLASPSLFGDPRPIRVGGVERLSEAFLTEALRHPPASGGRDCTRFGRRMPAPCAARSCSTPGASGLGGGVGRRAQSHAEDRDRSAFASA